VNTAAIYGGFGVFAIINYFFKVVSILSEVIYLGAFL